MRRTIAISFRSLSKLDNHQETREGERERAHLPDTHTNTHIPSHDDHGINEHHMDQGHGRART